MKNYLPALQELQAQNVKTLYLDQLSKHLAIDAQELVADFQNILPDFGSSISLSFLVKQLQTK